MQRWSWAGDILAPAGQAVMETTWLYAWVFVTASAAHSANPGFAAMAILFAAGAWIGRLGRLLPWRYPLNYAVLLPATVIAPAIWLRALILPNAGWEPASWALLASPVGWDKLGINAGTLAGICGLGLYLWCRGMWIGVRPPSTETLDKWLIGGAAAFVMLFAILAAGKDKGVAPLAGALEALVLGYFVIGLSVIGLVHAQTLHRRAATRQPISVSWVIALIVPMAGVAGLGVLVSSNLAPLINQLMRVLVQIVLLLWQVLLWIGYWLLLLLAWLARLFPAGTPGGSGARVLRAKPPPAIRRPEWAVAPVHVSPWPLYVVLGLMAVLLVFVFFRLLLRRPRLDSTAAIDEERNSLWSWQLFCEQLRALWDRLLGRVRRRQAALLAWTGGFSAAKGVEPAPDDIRQIYRRLLLWAIGRGHPRRPATTPHELLVELTASVPRAARPVELITALYERIRYGGREIDDQTFTAAKAASVQLDATTVETSTALRDN